MRRASLSLLTVVSAWAAACSVIYPVDNLVGPPRDAGASDGGIGSEGAVDGGCNGSWCACQSPTHRFCEDFDEGDVFDGGLTWTVSPNGGTLGLAEGVQGAAPAYVSAPYSASFRIPSLDGGPGYDYTPGPQISRPFASVTKLSCAFDLRILALDPDPRATVVPFQVVLKGTRKVSYEALFWEIGHGESDLDVTVAPTGGGPATTTSAPLDVLSGWNRYAFSIEPSANPGAGPPYLFRGGLDGQPPTASVSIDAFDNTGFTLAVGIAFTRQFLGDTSVLIDNVTCDW